MNTLLLSLVLCGPQVEPHVTRAAQLQVNGLVFDPMTQHWFQHGVDVSVQAFEPGELGCNEFTPLRGIE